MKSQIYKTLKLGISGFKEARRLTLLFCKAILWFVFLVCYCLFFVLWSSKNTNKFYAFSVIVVFFLFAHKSVEHLLIKLYKYVDLPRKPNKLTAALGYFDRAIYALCFAFQQYTAIGVWLGIKIAQRLVQFKAVDLEKHDQIKKVGERKNIFLIGNLASLILGIMAGYLIIVWFDLPKPNFWKSP